MFWEENLKQISKYGIFYSPTNMVWGPVKKCTNSSMWYQILLKLFQSCFCLKCSLATEFPKTLSILRSIKKNMKVYKEGKIAKNDTCLLKQQKSAL